MKHYCSFFLFAATIYSCQPSHPVASSGPAFTAEGREAVVYTTADSTEYRLTKTGTLAFSAAQQPLETEIAVFVNPDKRYQSFMGIGAAVTDAAAEVYAALPEARKQELLKKYFDTQEGIGYNLLRTTIHSCDFSSASYTYVEEGDRELKSFSIAHDQAYRIPMIKQILSATDHEVICYASPWSPPAFMKDNGSMLKGGKLLAEYAPAWAMYYARFIKAYAAEGIPVWGISVQNEPMATQRWESCIYTAEEERDFLKDHLGPTLEKEGLKDVRIIVWDHNRDLIHQRVNVILGDPEAARFVWGIGFHWYETWTGGDPMFANVGEVHASYPDRHLIFTEGCNEKFDSTRYQYWPNAERYGRSMIQDFNQGTEAWTDWNILLDQAGGPNHVGNWCFAPVHADTRTGQLIYTPSYYYIGHFSRFIRPGAVRLSTTASRSALMATTFLNVDGRAATVVMNPGGAAIHYKLFVGMQVVEQDIPAHAIQTIVY